MTYKIIRLKLFIHEEALKAAREVIVVPAESVHDKVLKAAREVTIKSLREKHHDDNISTNKNKIN